jgi:hypothetical protein
LQVAVAADQVFTDKVAPALEELFSKETSQ